MLSSLRSNSEKIERQKNYDLGNALRENASVIPIGRISRAKREKILNDRHANRENKKLTESRENFRIFRAENARRTFSDLRRRGNKFPVATIHRLAHGD